MTTSKKETALDWLANFIGLAGGIPAIAEKIGKLWGALPSNVQEQISQKMPGFMGLSKDDEQIFNSLLAKISIEKQRGISNFLFTRCQPFQRDSFRFIVAGMEIVRGTPEVVEKKWNEKAKKLEEKITARKDDEDLREMFLKRFADYIEAYGSDEAYNACLATNMFSDHSTFQNVKHSFGVAGEGVAEQASNASNSIQGTITFQNIKRSFGTEGEEIARQALREALAKRRRR